MFDFSICSINIENRSQILNYLLLEESLSRSSDQIYANKKEVRCSIKKRIKIRKIRLRKKNIDNNKENKIKNANYDFYEYNNCNF